MKQLKSQSKPKEYLALIKNSLCSFNHGDVKSETVRAIYSELRVL